MASSPRPVGTGLMRAALCRSRAGVGELASISPRISASPTHLDHATGPVVQPGQIAGREHFNQVDAALPALEAAFVDARLDIVPPQARLQLGVYCRHLPRP